MSRLIDADELIKYIKIWEIGTSISSEQKEFIDCVNKQPTTFDVDKISKELVKQKKIANKKMNESDDTYSMSYYDGFSSGIAIAIGIVKDNGDYPSNTSDAGFVEGWNQCIDEIAGGEDSDD